MKRTTRRQFFEQALGASALTAMGVSVLVADRSTPAIIGRAHAKEGDLGKAPLKGVEYFQNRNDAQKVAVKKLQDAIRSRDLAASKQAYIDSRPPYEEIEVLAGSFEESDSDIDARPYAFDGGETSDDFRGFHKIEYLLFRDDDLDMAGKYADTLAESVERLGKELTEPERYNPKGHFEGMIGLAEEIGSKKISSEEETWSDQSMLIFLYNINGIYSQYKPFGEILAQKDEKANKDVGDAYAAFLAILKPHKTGPGEALTPYSKVGTAERKKISDATYRLRDSLINAGGKLNILDGA